MTCIVAVSDGRTVVMGGDSAAAEMEGQFVSSRVEPKVFIRNEYIIGYAGSFRFGKIVEHCFNVPDPKYTDIDKFMNTTFVSELRQCCEENKIDNAEDKDSGELLIGLHGRIFELNGDWHIGEDMNNFNSIGSGSSFALGSLYSTGRYKDNHARIKLALESAEKFSPYVRRPFKILES